MRYAFTLKGNKFQYYKFTTPTDKVYLGIVASAPVDVFIIDNIGVIKFSRKNEKVHEGTFDINVKSEWMLMIGNGSTEEINVDCEIRPPRS